MDDARGKSNVDVPDVEMGIVREGRDEECSARSVKAGAERQPVQQSLVEYCDDTDQDPSAPTTSPRLHRGHLGPCEGEWC